MYIDEAIFEGFIPTSLSNIHYIRITPKTREQIIIGTNGCGKSSLLRELSCLPGDHKDYLKGGSKTIKLTHAGKSYILVSDFKHGNRHSFQVMVNGEWEEMNGGGTYTVQKELCKKYFRYTMDIHLLMIGQTGLSTLPTAKRRELITDMSGSDLDYALDVYKQLKDKARDYVGVTKHLNARLTVESAKILNPERIAELETLAKQTTAELNAMMMEMEPNLPSTESVKREIQQLMDTIAQTSRQALRIPLVRPIGFAREPWKNMDDVYSALQEAKQEHAVNESKLNGFKEDFREIQEIVEALSRSDSSGIEELGEKVRTLNERKTELTGMLREYHVIVLTNQVRDETVAIEQMLIERILEIPENNEKELNRTKYDQYQREMETDHIARVQAEHQLERIEHRIEHMREANTANCPQCGYAWKPGVSEKELEDLKTKSKNIQEYITTLDLCINDKKTYVDRVNDFQYQLKLWRQLMDQYPKLQAFWAKVSKEGWAATSPRRILLAFETWKHDIWICCELEEIERVLKEYGQAIEFSKHLNTDDQSHFSQRLDLLNQRIEEHTERSIQLRLRVQDIHQYSRRMEDFFKMAGLVEQQVAELRRKLDTMLRATKSSILAETISDHQVVLSTAKETLISAYISNDVVKDLSKDRDAAEERQRSSQLLANELSPLDGLIAEQLSHFIGALVGEVNKIVGAIWSYDLEMLPCGLTSGELDYRFPLVVKNSDLQPSDISIGSSSQREVFDFGFKLVTMVYLELEDFPLYLDEVGKSLDEHHRIRITRYINDLMEEGRYSQMWMISHYVGGYGSFSNAEIMMVDSMNILNLPHVFNQHVEIR